MGATVRQLISAGLNQDAATSTDPHVRAVSLAALVAAEHAVLMVASILPEGERRMRELGRQAALAAEDRLALFRDGEEEAAR